MSNRDANEKIKIKIDLKDVVKARTLPINFLKNPRTDHT
jgi:hypothetical protein